MTVNAKAMRKEKEERALFIFSVVYLIVGAMFTIGYMVCSHIWNLEFLNWIWGILFGPVVIAAPIALTYYAITAWKYIDGSSTD